MEQMTSICDMVGQIMQKKEEERRIAEDQAAKDRYWKILICYDDDEDYTIAITPVLLTEEPVDSLIIEDEHLDTIPETESDELIKSSVKDLVHTPSESDGISEGKCDLPVYNDFYPKKDEVLDDIISIPPAYGNDHINVESSLIESVLNRDNVISSPKIDFLIEEFAGELALIAPIPSGIVEADLDPNEDILITFQVMTILMRTSIMSMHILSDSNDDVTSSDDDDFEDIEYVDASLPDSELVSLEEVNDVNQEEKVFELEDIFQIQDVILQEKLLNVKRLIANIESFKDNPTPNRVLKSHSSFPIPVMDSDSFFEESDTSFSHSDNSLPEFETFSHYTEETRSGSTTTHANNSLLEYDSFLFEIEPDQGGLTSVFIPDNSNDPLLELPEFESFHFDLYDDPSPEPPNVEICLNFEPDTPVINNFDKLNKDECFDPGGGEINVSQNVEDDDSFTFVIQTFLPFLTYLVDSPLLLSTESEDTNFDPDIST
ncbi:hypothetical protein Tco_0982978 [Tanacetum coccineum]